MVRKRNNMPEKVWLTLGFIAFLAVYHLIGNYFGLIGKIWMVGLVIFLSIGFSIITWILRRRLKSNFDAMSPEQQSIYLAADPEFISEGSKKHSWKFQIIDGVTGIICIFLPSILVSVFREEALSWSMEFTGYHLLATLSGFAFYAGARSFMIRRLSQGGSIANYYSNTKKQHNRTKRT